MVGDSERGRERERVDSSSVVGLIEENDDKELDLDTFLSYVNRIRVTELERGEESRAILVIEISIQGLKSF